jgi:hypothetical protein
MKRPLGLMVAFGLLLTGSLTLVATAPASADISQSGNCWVTATSSGNSLTLSNLHCESGTSRKARPWVRSSSGTTYGGWIYASTQTSTATRASWTSKGVEWIVT